VPSIYSQSLCPVVAVSCLQFFFWAGDPLLADQRAQHLGHRDVTNRLNLTPVALMEGTCFAVRPLVPLLSPWSLPGVPVMYPKPGWCAPGVPLCAVGVPLCAVGVPRMCPCLMALMEGTCFATRYPGPLVYHWSTPGLPLVCP